MTQLLEKEVILTVDFEEWFHGAYPKYSGNGKNYNFKGRTDKITPLMLELMDRYSAKATFFVLGETAESQPNLIQEIQSCGHEIASHGYSHKQAYLLGPEKFREDVLKSVEIIGSITGRKPAGFRAPNFSIEPRKTPWAFEILEEAEFQYDSSVFPAIMYYGGALYFSRFIDKIGSIEEFPLSCFNLAGIRVSFSGGFFLRTFPRWLLARGIEEYWRLGQPPVLYLHPKDIDESTPSLPINWAANFVHNGMCKNGLQKFEWLLKFGKAISIEQYRKRAIDGKE